MVTGDYLNGEGNPWNMPSRWRHAGKRGVADTIWGIVGVVGAVVVLSYALPTLVKKWKEGAKEAGSMIGEFEGQREAARKAAVVAKK
jgi:hypothetical protein